MNPIRIQVRDSELAAVNDGEPCTELLENGDYILLYWLSPRDGAATYEWRLTYSRGNFILTNSASSEMSPGVIVAYSVEAYYRVYNARDLISGTDNTNACVIAFFKDLARRLSRVTRENMSEVCAWIVQLSFETDKIGDTTFHSVQELGIALQALIADLLEAIKKDK